ncbi:4Fe-4S dicluster domain-containing protein [Desulfurivibrio dismutans]|uniref:4Fe-4S dicluster domain-containing protein n=1 Tax=Desulfurivibrio dismutans TaxID=1398908 RepID=UPI0023DA0BC8|nr:4Fe-4S dicluster domain-containing protein [Desulfurivibrio alkaliphilus]MDF1614435.1 4Fe-4S dicluster domain-containing protein [Desulfurivibrio alkaliphilus]
MTNYAMTHDLKKCMGCGACLIACKIENNVTEGIKWLNYETKTTGKFPNVSYEVQLNQCNHCDNAPCTRVCPTRAMHKRRDTGLTLHNPKRCVGCRACMVACPYDAISFNRYEPHAMFKDDQALVPGGTSSGRELTSRMEGAPPIPTYNPALNQNYLGIRKKGLVEKCTFCSHRLARGQQPRCVEACPAGARLLGDLDDPVDPIHELIARYPSKVRMPEQGTKPKVIYLRNYGY